MNNLNSNTCILPIKEPAITSYTTHANLLSVLETYPKAMPWILNNYIPIYMSRDFQKVARMDFYFGGEALTHTNHWKNCPWLVYHGLSKDLVKNNWESITKFTIDCINSGYYINFQIDPYYVHEYRENGEVQKTHSQHPIMIFGYD